MSDLHFFPNLPIEKKRNIRKILETNIQQRKEQIEALDSMLIQPIRDMVMSADDVLKGNLAVEHYVSKSKRFHEWFTTFFEKMGK